MSRNMEIDFCGVKFKNPVVTSSGTFGFGKEYNDYYDISALGGIGVKGLTLKPRTGNPPPRVAETPSGMLNSVGLQNPGVESFFKYVLPQLKKLTPISLSIFLEIQWRNIVRWLISFQTADAISLR